MNNIQRMLYSLIDYVSDCKDISEERNNFVIKGDPSTGWFEYLLHVTRKEKDSFNYISEILREIKNEMEKNNENPA